MVRALVAWGWALAVVACSAEQAGIKTLVAQEPPPDPLPSARVVPPSTAGQAADLAQAPVGAEPPGFHDPSGDSPFPWLKPGRWRMAATASGRVWQCQETHPQPYLSFRVWRGTSLGPRYRLEATVQPLASPFFKAPVGEISIIPYYLDPTHYLEINVTEKNVSVWVADGGEPGHDAGWRGLRFEPVTTGRAQLQAVTALADLAAGTLTVAAGGRRWTVTDRLLRPRPHTVALRSTGNAFNVHRFRVD